MIHAHTAFERAEATLDVAALAALLADPVPPCQVLIAERGEVLLGYAALTFDYALWRGSRWAHLDCLYVRATHRGQAIGQRLLHAACAAAKAEGADRMEWQTPEWNERATAFYCRIGAAMTAKTRFALVL
ncbi:GNAT family N-acetyltransferase [Novosphingobium sp.]|uniref:GNAT family N-acetyltransferase n=1 Tax=Novosphingobium sp. TaxID=1874826 RepID=UPI0026098CFA|nr:GNAT family N-acetyltransferase [Novosphingobium sp.]